MTARLLFIAHVIASCVSLVCVGIVYEYLRIIPNFSATRAFESIAITSAFAVAGFLLFARARFSFGYLVGFYFFALILGYVWIAPSSRFSYSHEIAAASAFISGLAFLVPALHLTIPFEQRFSLSEAGGIRLLLAILLATVALLLIGAFYNLRLVGLSEIYEFRSKIVFPLPVRYAIGVTSTALLPFAFACFIERQQRWLAAACLVLLFAFYPLTLTKTAVFAPLWLMFLALLSRYFDARAVTILSLLLPTTVGLLALAASNYSIFGLINFRMVAIPSISIDVYNDFFAHHPLTHFCQVRMLQSFIACPYSDPLGTVMEDTYHLGSFNAPMFATEGIASVGLAASPLVALACGLLVSLAKSASRNLPPRFVLLSSGVLIEALMNVPFTTAILTHGAGLLVLLWYVTSKDVLKSQGDSRVEAV